MFQDSSVKHLGFSSSDEFRSMEPVSSERFDVKWYLCFHQTMIWSTASRVGTEYHFNFVFVGSQAGSQCAHLKSPHD